MLNTLFYASTRVTEIDDELQLINLDIAQIELNITSLNSELSDANKPSIVLKALEKEKARIVQELVSLNEKSSKLIEEKLSLSNKAVGESILTSLKEIVSQTQKMLDPNADRSMTAIRELVLNISKEVEGIAANLNIIEAKGSQGSYVSAQENQGITSTKSDNVSFEDFLRTLPSDLSHFIVGDRNYPLEAVFKLYKKELSLYSDTRDLDLDSLLTAVNLARINNGKGIEMSQLKDALGRASISISSGAKTTALCIEYKNNTILEATNKETVAKFFKQIGLVDIYAKCYSLFSQTFTLNPLKSISKEVPYYSTGIECCDFYLIANRRTKDLISKLEEVCAVMGIEDVKIYAVGG